MRDTPHMRIHTYAAYSAAEIVRCVREHVRPAAYTTALRFTAHADTPHMRVNRIRRYTVLTPQHRAIRKRGVAQALTKH